MLVTWLRFSPVPLSPSPWAHGTPARLVAFRFAIRMAFTGWRFRRRRDLVRLHSPGPGHRHDWFPFPRSARGALCEALCIACSFLYPHLLRCTLAPQVSSDSPKRGVILEIQLGRAAPSAGQAPPCALGSGAPACARQGLHSGPGRGSRLRPGRGSTLGPSRSARAARARLRRWPEAVVSLRVR